jgi:hypothetical protein
MDGLYKVWARRSFKIRPAKVKIRIGTPFYAKDIVPHSDEPAANHEQSYADVTDHLKQTISSMIDEMRTESRGRS